MDSTQDLSTAEKKRKRAHIDHTVRKAPKLARPSNEEPHLDIATLELQIKESHKHYNNLATLLTLARKDFKLQKSSTPAILALCRAFCRLQADGRLSKSKVALEKAREVVDWLKDRYLDYKRLLLKILEQSDGPRQELAINLAMQLVREDCSGAGPAAGHLLKTGFFSQILSSILRMDNGKQICEFFAEGFAQDYDDIRHATFEIITQIIADADRNEEITINSLSMLSKLQPPPPEGMELTKFFVSGGEYKSAKKLAFSVHRKQGQQAWLAVLSTNLDQSQRKLVLGYLTYRVLPWMQNSEVLMDFLTDSYNTGGATSLLALSGLFQLMQEKNLDYPDFFIKLYSLLDNQLLYSKHRSRFFRLLNTFMSSTHLPAAIAASFVKKLSRLALHGPPAGVVAIVPWVYNMLKAHPTCTFMIHREPRSEWEREDLEEYGLHDCFDAEERDPMKTCAIDSCLWELETLQSHYHPNVASLAKVISEQFTKAHYNIDDFLDHSYSSLIESELARELKKTPVVEFEIPKTIFTQSNGDKTLETIMMGIMNAE